MNARLLLLLAILTGSAHASSLGVATSTEGYAYWETFASSTGSGVVTITDFSPTSFDSTDFSASLSAAMSGSTPGGGDRIYSGVMASSNPFNLTIDVVANSAFDTFTLQLKATGPLQNVAAEDNIGPAGDHFSVTADAGWGAFTQTYLGYSVETAGTFYIYAWTWTGLGIEASDTFEIGITSDAGHVSLDAIRIDAGTVSAVPEPASFAALAGFGALGAAALRRRRCA